MATNSNLVRVGFGENGSVNLPSSTSDMVESVVDGVSLDIDGREAVDVANKEVLKFKPPLTPSLFLSHSLPPLSTELRRRTRQAPIQKSERAIEKWPPRSSVRLLVRLCSP